jgi:hypothetical protein
VAVIEPSTWNAVAAVLVTLEAGWGETDPMPVLTMAGKDGDRVTRHSVRLTWCEAEALADWLGRSLVWSPHPRRQETSRRHEVSTDHEASEWEHALLRIGASGTLEATGTAVVVEHDATDDTLRLHAPERTDVERVREVVRAAAVALGIVT